MPGQPVPVRREMPAGGVTAFADHRINARGTESRVLIQGLANELTDHLRKDGYLFIRQFEIGNGSVVGRRGLARS